MRSGPLRIGGRRPGTDLRSCGHRCSRGIAGTRPGRISCVWNVETPSWSIVDSRSRLGCGGRPTVREAEVRGGNRTPMKRMPVVERQRENGSDGAGPPTGCCSYNRPDTGSGARLRERADMWRVECSRSCRHSVTRLVAVRVRVCARIRSGCRSRLRNDGVDDCSTTRCIRTQPFGVCQEWAMVGCG
jgi:hypothetical protein